MAFISKDIVTADGVTKKAFYTLIGMESENGTIVQIKQFVGEFTQAEVLAQKEQVLLRVAELDDKLTHFVV